MFEVDIGGVGVSYYISHIQKRFFAFIEDVHL